MGFYCLGLAAPEPLSNLGNWWVSPLGFAESS
jgi:hypothetical protein